MLRKHLQGFWAAFELRRTFYLFLGFGLLLRVAALALVGGSPLGNEAPGYYRTSLAILHNENYSIYWPPGVPYYLYVAQKLFGEGILVARAAIIPLYLVFSVGLYRLARLITTRRAANLLVLSFALYPPYIRYAFNPSTEYPAAALLVGLLYLALRAAATRRLVFAIAAGVCIGALTLLRPGSAVFLLAIPLYFFFSTKRARMALIPLFAGSLVVALWVVKSHSMSGRWVFVNEANAENLFWGNNPYTPLYRTWPEGQAEFGLPADFRVLLEQIRNEPEESRGRLQLSIALDHIIARPDLFLLRSANRMRAYFGFPVHHGEPLRKFAVLARPPWLVPLALTVFDLMFYWPIMVLAILAVFACFRGPPLEDPMIAIVGTALLYAIPYWVAFSQPRYNFPVVPLFAVLAVKFLDIWSGERAKLILAPVLAPGKRRAAVVGTLILFVYIQLEWIAIFYFRI